MISFDQILEKRIGTGFYQWKTLSIVGLVEFCDGIEYTFMSILIAILKKEWDLTQSQVASLGSVFLFGIVIGNFLCAFITDYIGRKKTFTIFTSLACFLVYYTSFCSNYNEMIVLRLLFGIVVGTTYPLGYIFISEIAVANNRGRFSFGLQLIYIFGKIYFVCFCFVFLDDYTTGNWRGLIRFNGFPIAAAFILSLLFLQETIRYLLNKGQFQKAFEEIELVLQQNNQQEIQLTEEEKQGLQNWSNQQQLEHQEQELNKFGVLSPEYRKITIILWCLYILTNLQNMSIYLLMPFLFAQNNSGFLPMLNIFIVEFIFALIIYQFIDDPNYGGRIRIIIYSGIALIISNGLLFFFKDKFLYIGLFIVKIATRGLFSTISLVCCEIYPLQIRSQGCGISQAIGKIAAIPSPYFLFPLFFIEPYLPFGLMFLLSILILILALTISSDKTQKYLETIKNE